MGVYLNHLLVKQSPDLTAKILGYEAGDINKCQVHVFRYGTKRGYAGEIKAAIADAQAMVNLLIEQYNHSKDDIEMYALERFIEAQRRLKASVDEMQEEAK